MSSEQRAGKVLRDGHTFVFGLNLFFRWEEFKNDSVNAGMVLTQKKEKEGLKTKDTADKM